MNELHVDIMITGSQKALACPPGVSVIVLSKKAIERAQSVRLGASRRLEALMPTWH